MASLPSKQKYDRAGCVALEVCPAVIGAGE